MHSSRNSAATAVACSMAVPVISATISTTLNLINVTVFFRPEPLHIQKNVYGRRKETKLQNINSKMVSAAVAHLPT